MQYNKVSESLRRIAKKALSQDDLASDIIIQKGKTYHAFNAYIIEETEFGWQVTSELFDKLKLFNTAKAALAWCILYKTHNLQAADTLLFLDRCVSKKQFDIDIITFHLDNNTYDAEQKAISIARLMEDINDRQSYKKQLSKWIVLAKYIKLKGNNNELNRLRKTSRRNSSC